VSDTNEQTTSNSISSLSKTGVLRRARKYAERVLTTIDAGRCDALADLMAARALLLLATAQSSLNATTPALIEATAAVAQARTRYVACCVRHIPRDGARA
jgi:hypothetical protein